MFRMPQIRPITYAALAGIGPAAAGIAWLFGRAIVEGHELTAAEDITFELLIGAVILLTLSWLVLRYQSRSRTKFQQEIDAGKRKLDTAISNMSQGLVMFDASHRVVLCNRRYLDLYDLSPEIVKPGLHFRDLLLHRKQRGSFLEDVDEYYDAIVANYANGNPQNLISEGSGGRLVQIVNAPLQGGGWVATHEDVTERLRLLEAHKRSEEIVRDQERRLDGALNNMSHGLCMFDSDGRIVLFNHRYTELMGERAEFLQGLSLLELFRHRKVTGAFLGDPDEFFSKVLARARAGDAHITEMVRLDGTTLRVVNQPMEGG